jgi:hypothetical protein
LPIPQFEIVILHGTVHPERLKHGASIQQGFLESATNLSMLDQTKRKTHGLDFTYLQLVTWMSQDVPQQYKVKGLTKYTP